jgi:ribosomal protein S18 acetylase RimI-like enzyme
VIEIRPYQPQDEESVVILWNEAFPDDPPWNEPAAMIKRKLAVQPELFLVGAEDGRVVATVLAGYNGVRGLINHLAVHSSVRRRGVGRLMMQAAEQALAKLGCPKVNLQVRPTNKAVVGFYQALGYSVEERVSMGKRLE